MYEGDPTDSPPLGQHFDFFFLSIKTNPLMGMDLFCALVPSPGKAEATNQ